MFDLPLLSYADPHHETPSLYRGGMRRQSHREGLLSQAHQRRQAARPARDASHGDQRPHALALLQRRLRRRKAPRVRRAILQEVRRGVHLEDELSEGSDPPFQRTWIVFRTALIISCISA